MKRKKICCLHIFAGKPILAALSDETQLVMATLVFLVVFYCPGDLGFSLITIPPVYATVCTMKEIQRALKVTKGIKEGLEFNPNSAFAAVLIGTIKGNGSGFCTPFTRAIRGVWSGNLLPISDYIYKESVLRTLHLKPLIFSSQEMNC